MTAPRQVSRQAFEAFDGVRWNAYVDLLAMSDLAELTPLQRVAHLAFWYDSEVQNGGHDQYFANKASFDQAEVAQALETLGAVCHAGVLRRAWAFAEQAAELAPDDYREFDAWNESYGYGRQLLEFDLEYGACSPELSPPLLESYLDAHESEFIDWVDDPAAASPSGGVVTPPFLVLRPTHAFWIEDEPPTRWSATTWAAEQEYFRDARCFDLLGNSWPILGAELASQPSPWDRLRPWRRLTVTVSFGPLEKATLAQLVAGLTPVLRVDNDFCDYLKATPEEIRRRLEEATNLPDAFAIVREVCRES